MDKLNYPVIRGTSYGNWVDDVHAVMIFEVGGSEGQGRGHRGANENCCYRTFN